MCWRGSVDACDRLVRLLSGKLTGRVPPHGVADHVENLQVTLSVHGVCVLVAYQPAMFMFRGHSIPGRSSQLLDREHDRLHHEMGHRQLTSP